MKIIRILSIFLFLAVFISTSLGANLILRDNFEEGAAWTYGTHWNVAIKELNNKWQIVTENPHSGRYCAKSKNPYPYGWANSSCFHSFLNNWNGYKELFIRFWLKAPKDFYLSSGGSNTMRFGTGRDRGDWGNGGEYCLHNGWLHIYNTGVKWETLPRLSRDNTWHEYAYYMKMSDPLGSPNGIWRAWKDANGNYSPSNTLAGFRDMVFKKMITHIILPWYFKGDPGEYTFYMDDVEIWDGVPDR